MKDVTPKDRTKLMNEFTTLDSSADGYLTLSEFKKGFFNAGLTIDGRLIDEVFELLGEKFAENDF